MTERYIVVNHNSEYSQVVSAAEIDDFLWEVYQEVREGAGCAYEALDEFRREWSVTSLSLLGHHFDLSDIHMRIREYEGIRAKQILNNLPEDDANYLREYFAKHSAAPDQS